VQREQIYDDLLKKIETSANPEEISLDSIDYHGLRNGRAREKLETAQKSRRTVLEREKKEAREREEEKRRREQEINSRVTDYENLLSSIQTAIDLSTLTELGNQINAFNYQDLPTGKNKDALEIA